ncbi:MAG: hypothetical protein GXP32_03570 [Kiritimatiellaeota bacterium]|nr:hypothetical protein [Kiritimatiellota bacterium]
MKMKTGMMVAFIVGLIFVLLALFSGKPANRRIWRKPRKTTEVEIEIIKVEPRMGRQKERRAKSTAAVNQGNEGAPSRESNGGACPPLNASYRRHVGFAAYSKAMRNLGADFYIAGSGTRRLYRIDFDDKMLLPTTLERIKHAGYSSRTRVIGDEPALNGFLNMAEREYKIANPEVLLLIPGYLENKIAMRLSKSLKKLGLSFKDVAGFKGEYMKSGDRLVLKVNEAVMVRTGKKIRMGLSIYL